MSLGDVRQAIATQLGVQFQGVKIWQHDGRVTFEEIKRWATGCPALIVVCVGVPSAEVEGGMTVGEAGWAVCALTKNLPGQTRGVGGMLLASALLSIIPQQRWHDPNGNATVSKRAEHVHADAIYEEEIDKLNVNLWIVSWLQGVDLLPLTPIVLNGVLQSQATGTAGLADFLRFGDTEMPAAPVDGTVLPTTMLETLLAFTAPTITTTSPLPAGHNNVPYVFSFAGVNGNAPYTWSVVSGSLPTGLTLLSTGAFAGTPTVPGPYTFVVQLLDSQGTLVSGSFSLTIGAT